MSQSDAAILGATALSAHSAGLGIVILERILHALLQQIPTLLTTPSTNTTTSATNTGGGRLIGVKRGRAARDDDMDNSTMNNNTNNTNILEIREKLNEIRYQIAQLYKIPREHESVMALYRVRYKGIIYA